MKDNTLFYITSNARKVAVAEKFLGPLGFSIQQKNIDLVENQTEDIEKIAIQKAQQAYEQFKHPLFVNDAGWYIP
ncbi:MAG: non-canonical purine NTP pyrophosphatase, partial [Patescibacteria group bacterium]